MAEDASSVISFWLDDVGEKRWYEVDEGLDQQIRDRFGKLWEEGAERNASPFPDTPEGALAALLLFDQFPRNMFRGKDTAFATDPLARGIAKSAIARDYDLAIPLPQRQFFYLPYMHAEDLDTQDEGIRLIEDRMGSESTALHARAHRELISRFGRFPFRNDALGRKTTPEEQAFMDEGGYPALVKQLQNA